MLRVQEDALFGKIINDNDKKHDTLEELARFLVSIEGWFGCAVFSIRARARVTLSTTTRWRPSSPKPHSHSHNYKLELRYPLH
ncbi:hypothetical protein SLEP1_g52747 [Rubroshorea leprosula]|uniref:Uncharacterized protein n=1 Tax=Rubroshorea leprosula TaxID=152421 RepID=A0AAV5M900_9ROSI|nr:hypothetical protein SLEP1_g52747 [Rubroshorea leprosula]